MIIDAHQHVWALADGRYGWLARETETLKRTIPFAELKPQLVAAGVDATVLVQADDNDADTDDMLAVAAENPEVVGVVGYVPLERPEEAAARLAALRENPLMVGIRNLIHDRADPDWMLRPDVDEGLGVLERAGVPFDYVAVLPRHLEHLPELRRRHPALRIVIDHLAKPPIGLAARPSEEDRRQRWWDLMAAAAENPLVYGKVSGLYSATSDPASWTPEQLRPFVDRALELFGPDRLMYGGDWPVSLVAGGYVRVLEGIREVLSPLSPSEQARIFGRTATEFYGLSTGRADSLDR
jgi:L-fuconolactonase